MINNRFRIYAHLSAAIFSCVVLTCLGCGSGDYAGSAISNANRTNIQRLANLYGRFQTCNRWRGPKTEAELKEFITKLDDKTLGRMGVERSEVDGLFVSERDGQPFTVKWGVQGASRGEPKPVIFEQTGVDGQRQVGFTQMKQEIVDASEYEKLLAGS